MKKGQLLKNIFFNKDRKGLNYNCITTEKRKESCFYKKVTFLNVKIILQLL